MYDTSQIAFYMLSNAIDLIWKILYSAHNIWRFIWWYPILRIICKMPYNMLHIIWIILYTLHTWYDMKCMLSSGSLMKIRPFLKCIAMLKDKSASQYHKNRTALSFKIFIRLNVFQFWPNYRCSSKVSRMIPL